MLSEEERLSRLAEEARKRGFPPLRPVDAATLVILDRKGPKPRVLMGKRHSGHKFMPGVFVFPGGRSEKGDVAVPLAGDLPAETQRALSCMVRRPTPRRCTRLALAAVRETFEETGIVIGQARPDLPSLTGPWGDFLATGHAPDLSRLAYFARAITPPGRPKRFDTRFFAVESQAIAHQVPDIVTPESELTELAWLTLEETESLPLPVITRVMLGELQGWLEAGSPRAPGRIPFYFERHRTMRREMIAPGHA